MKFIHTSDWHIGRQFHNVCLLEDQRHVLDQIVDYIAKEAVDALVIAGDIYDRSVPPAKAVALLDEFISKICSDMMVPVILIPGNPLWFIEALQDVLLVMSNGQLALKRIPFAVSD